MAGSGTLDYMPGAHDAFSDTGDDDTEVWEKSRGPGDQESHALNAEYAAERQKQHDELDSLHDLDDEALYYLNNPLELQKQLHEAASREEVLPPPRQAHSRRAYKPEHHVRDEPGDSSAGGNGNRSGERSTESDRKPDVTVEEAEEAEKAEDEFRKTLHGVRLVYDFGTNEVVGVATWDAGKWSLHITPVRTSAEAEFLDIGINLITGLVAQTTGTAVVPPTSLDKAVGIAMDLANPGAIALKLCNAAVQCLTYHMVGPVMASALGSLVEQILSPAIDPPNRLSNAIEGVRTLDVAVDVATGQLTPAVHDSAVSGLAALLRKENRGITQAELDEIEEAIRGKTASSQTANN